MDEFILPDIQAELMKLRGENAELRTSIASSSYGNSYDRNNLIEQQIETGQMLDKLEHFLRGERIEIDAQGNEYWAKQKNKNLILFNDYGVNAIMSIIGNYIDKNTILSFYDEMRIFEILADLGDELNRFILCNYEIIGMDTDLKKTRYQLVVVTILHSIESSYRRAIRGKTLEDVNSSRIVTQTDPLRPQTPQQPVKRGFFSWLKPSVR